MLTLVPWRGRALVGTSQSAHARRARRHRRSRAAEVDAFIAEANDAFPALQLTRADVTLVHRGIVPAVETRGGSAGAEAVAGDSGSRHRRRRRRDDGHRREVHDRPRASPSATSRSSARRSASVCARRARPTTALPGAGIADHEALAIETARDAPARCSARRRSAI